MHEEAQGLSHHPSIDADVYSVYFVSYQSLSGEWAACMACKAQRRTFDLQRLEHLLGTLLAVRLELLVARELVQTVVHGLVVAAALDHHEQALLLRAQRKLLRHFLALGDRDVVQLLAQFL